MTRPTIWKISAGACGVAWAVSMVITTLTSTGVEAWSLLLLNASGPATAVLFLWPRTTHPSDAYALGLIDGAQRERDRRDSRPGTGELHVVR